MINACNNDESNQQEDSIYGTWQLTKRQHVLPSSTQIIENGEMITFSNDWSFDSDSYLCEGLFDFIN